MRTQRFWWHRALELRGRGRTTPGPGCLAGLRPEGERTSVSGRPPRRSHGLSGRVLSGRVWSSRAVPARCPYQGRRGRGPCITARTTLEGAPGGSLCALGLSAPLLLPTPPPSVQGTARRVPQGANCPATSSLRSHASLPEQRGGSGGGGSPSCPLPRCRAGLRGFFGWLVGWGVLCSCGLLFIIENLTHR
ncbi:hypothetical protein HJG60_011398 [Phyllostomus discolor]|uniref:Uncharacterized protein n=1 Tax=Phyllostomus discolor TaxID=89673 RepID=A0A834E5J8_9CHIR|nr:hypothetical protein HJG60_011398 [Phyllostomus discolor]